MITVSWGMMVVTMPWQYFYRKIKLVRKAMEDGEIQATKIKLK
jgi:hypothetical protein